MANIIDLPREILVVIFDLILESEDQNFFISSISKVCKEWEAICQDEHFWYKFDGSLPSIDLYNYSNKGLLLKTKELTYSFTHHLEYSRRIEEIFCCLPNLKVVNFSRVRRLDHGVLSCLPKHCKNVNSIKIGANYTSRQIITVDLIGEFLTLQGHYLLTLDLSYTVIYSLKHILLVVANCCSNLEELILESITCGLEKFPLKEIQERCTKMKVLQLGHPIRFPDTLNAEELTGFPFLERFTYHISIDHSVYALEFGDRNLRNILSNSSNLKVLNLQGSRYISANAILSLPVTHLEKLYLSMSRFKSTAQFEEILTKWIRSLHTVDISATDICSINEMLSRLATKGMTNLRILDLSSTKVDAKTVVKLIENCENLKSLNLECCLCLGKTYMQKFRSRPDLLELRKNIVRQLNI